MPSYIYDYYLGNIKHMINILLFVRVTFIYLFHAHIYLITCEGHNKCYFLHIIIAVLKRSVVQFDAAKTRRWIQNCIHSPG
jgi:hypothetical protein